MVDYDYNCIDDNNLCFENLVGSYYQIMKLVVLIDNGYIQNFYYIDDNCINFVVF